MKPKPAIKSWEILLPVPLILDVEISDEEIISEIASASTENEAASIFSSAMQWPMESIVINCTKEDLFKALIRSRKGLKIDIEEYYDIYVITIKNKENGEIIGRGEISQLGEEMDMDSFAKRFFTSLNGFKDRYDEGQQRMSALTYKLKSLSDDMNLIASKRDEDNKKKSN